MSAETKPWTLQMTGPLEPGIVCVDLERMVDFYTKVLGLTLVGDAETAPELSARFRAAPTGYRIIRLTTPLGQKLKFVQPKIPVIRNTLPEWVFQRQGIAYLTFVVANIQEVVARLREHGVRLVSEEVVEVRKGILAIYTLDPEDNYIEFVEFPEPAA